MSDKRSVDDLRARLRDLGYLDAGVDRFVLGGVRSRGSLLSVAVRSSLRIGLLAALLLGPSTALALAARLPGLATGVRDGLVLALYLAVLFGAAVTVAALVAALLLGTMASRTGRARLVPRAHVLSGAAAVIVAGACLVYLVFWWRTVGPVGASSWGTAWTWAVLAIAAGVSLLLGRAVRLTTLALVAHESAEAPAGLRQGPRSRWLTLGLGVGAFAAAAALLFIVTPRGDVAARAGVPLMKPVSTGVDITVIAIDGVDTAFLDRLVQAGRVPTLRRLTTGARATLPASDAPDPARTWTSLATGQPAAVHGVSGIEARRVAGTEGTVATGAGGLVGMLAAATDLVRLTRPVLTTSEQRRSKTFWEVAAEHGLPTVVVNWWATWPVPATAGIVLSDRATLRLEVGGEQDAEIAPPPLYPTLRGEWPALRAAARQRVAAAFGAEAGDPISTTLRRAGEQDTLAAELTTRVTTGTPALRTVYLPGLDIAQHELVATAGSGLPASALASRVEALGRYYDYLDSVLASLLGGGGGDHLVLLVTDPGRSASGSSGILSVSGEGARAGVRIEAARRDVMPTILYAAGLPISRELPGRPRTELFADAFTARVPLRHVQTYGPRLVTPRPPHAAPLDQEMLDRLRSLGYVR